MSARKRLYLWSWGRGECFSRRKMDSGWESCPGIQLRNYSKRVMKISCCVANVADIEIFYYIFRRFLITLFVLFLNIVLIGYPSCRKSCYLCNISFLFYLSSHVFVHAFEWSWNDDRMKCESCRFHDISSKNVFDLRSQQCDCRNVIFA